MFTVTCSKCHARYNLDEARIPPQGMKAPCKKCGETLHIQKPEGTPTASSRVISPAALPDAPKPSAPSTAPSPAAAGADRTEEFTGKIWSVVAEGKNSEGIALNDLKLWIRQGQLLRQDKVKKSDEPWQEAGEHPDLVRYFEMTEARTAKLAGPAGPSDSEDFMTAEERGLPPAVMIGGIIAFVLLLLAYPTYQHFTADNRTNIQKKRDNMAAKSEKQQAERKAIHDKVGDFSIDLPFDWTSLTRETIYEISQETPLPPMIEQQVMSHSTVLFYVNLTGDRDDDAFIEYIDVIRLAENFIVNQDSVDLARREVEQAAKGSGFTMKIHEAELAEVGGYPAIRLLGEVKYFGMNYFTLQYYCPTADGSRIITCAALPNEFDSWRYTFDDAIATVKGTTDGMQKTY